MSPVYDCTADEQSADERDKAIDAAVEALGRGECIVLPTDTVYGIGADAFNASAVERLLAAKGRGREAPPPVLIPARMAVDGLAMNVPSYAKRLMDAFWPGALTIVVRSQPSLAWDLGDTNGTVALRIPDDEVARAVLERTGPLAVSSANQHGKPAATTVTEAGFALGPSVEVYLDGGERSTNTPSTIVDCTKADPVVLREGAISPEQLREVLAGVELVVPSENAGGHQFDGPEVADAAEAHEAAPSMPTLGQHWEADRAATDAQNESMRDEKPADEDDVDHQHADDRPSDRQPGADQISADHLSADRISDQHPSDHQPSDDNPQSR